MHRVNEDDDDEMHSLSGVVLRLWAMMVWGWTLAVLMWALASDFCSLDFVRNLGECIVDFDFKTQDAGEKQEKGFDFSFVRLSFSLQIYVMKLSSPGFVLRRQNQACV